VATSPMLYCEQHPLWKQFHEDGFAKLGQISDNGMVKISGVGLDSSTRSWILVF
jgi:hypothetical protein